MRQDDLLEDMASYFSILAWRIPWLEEPASYIVHGVTKSWTRLKLLSLHAHVYVYILEKYTQRGQSLIKPFIFSSWLSYEGIGVLDL